MNAETKPHIVLRGDKPCALVTFTGRRGDTVLLPDGPVAIFRSRRAARTAVKRSERIAHQLRNSLLSDWEKIAPLLNGEEYRVQVCEVPQS